MNPQKAQAHQYSTKRTRALAAGPRQSREDRASQGRPQHHHPLKRDRRTHASKTAGGCAGWWMGRRFEPLRACPEALVWWWERSWVGRGKLHASLLCRGIDVEAKDAGHKVAGLADDPRI